MGPDFYGTAISNQAIFFLNVGFNVVHDMQGYEEQLLNAMYDFEICAHE